MKLEIEIGGRVRQLELRRTGARVQTVIDGREVDAEVVELPNDGYSILIGGRSFEVHVEERAGMLQAVANGREFTAAIRDLRKFRRGSGTLLTEGRLQVKAPMPGKIVRLLVQAGERVEAGQGLLVVEAMKMQNEIRTVKAGIVEKLLAVEGQPVNAGDPLAIIV